MTDLSPFRIEAISLSSKEAQRAKSCLEKDLAEKRQHRCQLEKTLGGANAKWMQVKDIHTKMQETRNIAQFKVEKSQTLFDSLERANESKRDTLTKLDLQIKEENERREEDIAKFGNSLSLISQKMRDAKNLYSDEKLEKNYELSYTAQLEAEKLGEEYEKELSKMENYLKKVEEETERSKDVTEYLHNVELLLGIFEKAEKDADNYLQQIHQILCNP